MISGGVSAGAGAGGEELHCVHSFIHSLHMLINDLLFTYPIRLSRMDWGW